MEDTWLTFAKRLQAIAGSGLHFSENDYDRERYDEISTIARDMLAQLGNVPVTRIAELVPEHAKGYSTPQIDVRGALIENGKVLLVREKVDGLWSLPGGYADVGLSAGENIVKEIYEEAGLNVRAEQLFAVLHKARHPYPPDLRDFYKFFFLCRRDDATPPVPGSEALDVGFFARDEIPPLSEGRVRAEDIDRAFEFAADPSRPIVFD